MSLRMANLPLFVWLSPLSCSGSDTPSPQISVEPPTLDFGSVAAGTVKTEIASISNTGDIDLLVSSTRQEGSEAFDLLTDPQNVNLSPDVDVFAMVVTYTPVDSDGDEGKFTILSDDPDQKSVEVVLLGNETGGSD